MNGEAHVSPTQVLKAPVQLHSVDVSTKIAQQFSLRGPVLCMASCIMGPRFVASAHAVTSLMGTQARPGQSIVHSKCTEVFVEKSLAEPRDDYLHLQPDDHSEIASKQSSVGHRRVAWTMELVVKPVLPCSLCAGHAFSNFDRLWLLEFPSTQRLRTKPVLGHIVLAFHLING